MFVTNCIVQWSAFPVFARSTSDIYLKFSLPCNLVKFFFVVETKEKSQKMSLKIFRSNQFEIWNTCDLQYAEAEKPLDINQFQGNVTFTQVENCDTTFPSSMLYRLRQFYSWIINTNNIDMYYTYIHGAHGTWNNPLNGKREVSERRYSYNTHTSHLNMLEYVFYTECTYNTHNTYIFFFRKEQNNP